MILLFVTPTALVVLFVWASLSFTVAPSPPYQKASTFCVGGNQEEQKLTLAGMMSRELCAPSTFSRSEIPIAKEHQEIMDLADLSTPLPEWFTEENLAVYASLYEKSGFRYPLEMPYRSLHRRQPMEDPKFQVPVFVVIGEKDYVFEFPGVEAVLKDGIMEKFAWDLKITTSLKEAISCRSSSRTRSMSSSLAS